VLLRQSEFGLAFCSGLLVIWLSMHVWRAYHSDLERLNRWTWLPHKSMPDKNLALDRATAELDSLVKKNSLLVFGNYNQAYALVGSSYPTNIISPCRWLDSMVPNWETRLNDQLAKVPPKFILDSDACFDPLAAREKTGLRYFLRREFEGDFRLFELDGVKP
jgi:hypothetical protein